MGLVQIVNNIILSGLVELVWNILSFIFLIEIYFVVVSRDCLFGVLKILFA